MIIKTIDGDFFKGVKIMNRACTLASAFLISSSCIGFAFAQDVSPLDAEINAINEQIADVEATISSYEGGLIRVLAETRREALLLLRTVVKNRQQAEAGGAQIEVTVPAVEPSPERAEQLLGEMVAQKKKIEEAEKEAASVGGLIRAMALSRVETEKFTLAQLQMAYLQARYGIAFPMKFDFSSTTSFTSNGDMPDENAASSMDELSGTDLSWADPDYPEIDYSLIPFEQAHNEGNQISGWWVIEEKQAAIDDSLKIFAINYSEYNDHSFSNFTGLITRCSEGETSLIFVQDDFLMSELRRNSFDIIYRIDENPAQSSRWNELTSNKGAGIFGSSAESFLRKLYDAELFFIRLTERNGQQHDAEFDLAGVQDAIGAVASACGWSTLDLSQDDYRAIQTMLNVGGFEAGATDGIWGGGSRNAMRAFQEQNGLPVTGAPDRATLNALGAQESY
ncbi:peptidoglycan-binding protein [Halomonas sediminis]